MSLRLARQDDLAALNEIAFLAKSYWGYEPEQLEAWRPDIEVAATSLHSKPAFLAEADGRPAGFVQIATDTLPWEIWALWVHPTQMGNGIGKALLEHARSFAALHGQKELAIDSDPNAEGFYVAAGARTVGSIAAPIRGAPNRVRPQLRLSTSAA